MPKSCFFHLFFFQKFASGAKNLAKTASFYCFRRAQKINFMDLKKEVIKTFENFLKIRTPPRENPRSAPAANNILTLKLSHCCFIKCTMPWIIFGEFVCFHKYFGKMCFRLISLTKYSFSEADAAQQYCVKPLKILNFSEELSSHSLTKNWNKI